MLPSSSLCVCGPLSSSSRRSVRTVVAQSGQMRSFLPLPRSRHELAGRAAGHRNGHPQAPQFPCRGINPPSSSVTSLMRSAGFPEHESVHSATADKSRWGFPCFSGGESSATAARISRRAQAAAAVAATSANESRCVWPSHLGQTLRHAVSRSPVHALLQALSPVSPMRPVRTVRD